MKKLSLLIYVLVIFTSSYSQDDKLSEAERLEKGSQIVRDAQKTMGLEKIEIKSFYLKWKNPISIKDNSSKSVKTAEPITEISVMMPDKIQSSFIMDESFNSKSTSTWNGTKFRKISEFEMFGQRTVKDITNADSQTKENLKALEGKIDKEKLDNLKNFRKKDPKEDLSDNFWVKLFPLILKHPFEQNLDFKYVGKAESAGKFANVVDVKSKNGRTYRLLFDSETNYLLMMVVKYNIAEGTFDGDYEVKYYFSNRELVDNVLIPRTIKVEQKVTAAGKEPRISYSNIDIVEFKLNPEFKKDMFEIK